MKQHVWSGDDECTSQEDSRWFDKTGNDLRGAMPHAQSIAKQLSAQVIKICGRDKDETVVYSHAFSQAANMLDLYRNPRRSLGEIGMATLRERCKKTQ